MPTSKKYLVSKQRGPRRGWKALSREEKSDLRRFIQILAAIFVTFFILYYLGINGLTRIGGFWSIFTGEREVAQGDLSAPPPPTFAPLSPYTKSEKIGIAGFAEAGAEIILFVGEKEIGKTITEAGGTFRLAEVLLTEGKNTISATATDRAGNISQKSADLIVTLDRKSPDLEVSKPKNGQKFTGEKKQIPVEGKTEPGVTVRVNNIQATILAGGVFKATLIAKKPGEIKITIVATDKAGNEKRAELTVTYAAE